MADFEVNIILRAKDEARETVRALRGELSGLNADAGRRGRKGGLLGDSSSLANAASGVQQLTGLARSAIGAPLELSLNFEHAIKRVNAFSGGVLGLEGNLARMEERARELGGTTEFTATEVADAFAVLTQAGFTYEQQMAQIETVVDLATAAQVDMAKGADILGGTLGAFGRPAAEATDMADVLAKTAVLTQTDLIAMGQSMKDVGPIAQVMGFDAREAAAAIGVLGKSAITGGRAGKALRSILLDLDPTKKVGKKVLKALGISRADMKAALNSGDIGQPFELMDEAMNKKGIEDTDRARLMKTLFGKERSGEVLLLLRSVSEEAAGTEASLDFFQDGLKDTTGEVEKMADIMRSSTKAAIDELKSSLEELGLVIGDELRPMLGPLLEDAKRGAREFGEWAKENPELVRTLGKAAFAIVGVGTVLAPLLISLSSLKAILGFTTAGLSMFTRNTATAAAGTTKLTGAVGLLSRTASAGTVGLMAYAAGVLAIDHAYSKLEGHRFDLGSDFVKGHDVETANAQVDLLTSQIDQDKATLEKEQAALDEYMNDFFEVDYMKKRRLQQNVERTEAAIAAKEQAREALTTQVIEPERERQTLAAKETQRATLARTPDPAASAALEAAMQTLEVDTSGEIHLVVDDQRVKVKDIKSGDIPISVDAGLGGSE